jgi:G3E family GTPase
MGSVSILHEGEVDPNLFVPWLNEFVQREGADILRCKGIVAFADEPKRFVFQGVHMILDGDLQREWRADEKRNARLVFIGRKLKEETIRESFEKDVLRRM